MSNRENADAMPTELVQKSAINYPKLNKVINYSADCDCDCDCDGDCGNCDCDGTDDYKSNNLVK